MTGRVGARRKLLLALDPAQYHSDIKTGQDCYADMNLLIRRNPKENNFKSVLECIRDLLNLKSVETSTPSWLRDILLGYGNPSAAHYRSVGCIFCKTFLRSYDTNYD